MNPARREQMKKSLTIIPLVFLLCFTFGCQQPVEEVAEEAVAEVVALSDEDVAAIKTAHDAYGQTMISKDWAALIAMYTEDAEVMPPNMPLIQGREAIQAWSEASPPYTAFNLTCVEIDGRSDLAYVRGEYTLTMEIEGAPEPIQDIGKFITILQKQQGGSWLIALDIFNSDLPLPE
jgi:ketosteroid isomerase-like protein